MRIAKHGEKDAVHAVTYYAVVETAAHKFAWISLKPVTRSHPSVAGAYGPCRQPDCRRSKIFQH